MLLPLFIGCNSSTTNLYLWQSLSPSALITFTLCGASMKKWSRLKAAGQVELDAACKCNNSLSIISRLDERKDDIFSIWFHLDSPLAACELFKVAFSLSTWQLTKKIRSAVQSSSLWTSWTQARGKCSSPPAQMHLKLLKFLSVVDDQRGQQKKTNLFIYLINQRPKNR